jgi:hypothetical protein
MAMMVFTSRPRALKNMIEKALAAGDLKTWSQEAEGAIVHDTSSGQWVDSAKLYLEIIPDTALLVRIEGPSSENMKVSSYAVYLGRFAEMLLTHFDKSFSMIQIGALLEPGLGDAP